MNIHVIIVVQGLMHCDPLKTPIIQSNVNNATVEKLEESYQHFLPTAMGNRFPGLNQPVAADAVVDHVVDAGIIRDIYL
jgi:hypothetical protein